MRADDKVKRWIRLGSRYAGSNPTYGFGKEQIIFLSFLSLY